MPWRADNPWRCWERTTLAGVLNGPEGLLVRVALHDTWSHVYQSEFRWPSMVRIGPNDFGGSYSQVTLRFGEVRWSFEMAGDGERTYLVVRALDEEVAVDIELQLETHFQCRDTGQVVAREEEVVARRGERAYRIWSPTPTAHRNGVMITAPLERPFVAVIEPLAEVGREPERRTEAERRAGSSHTALNEAEREIVERVAQARRAYFDRFSFVPSNLWWAYAAIVYGIGWNMIWAADLGEPVQVCSRDWCVHGNYGEWVLFNWDTFLLVPAAAEYDVNLAHQIVRPQMAAQTPEGLIPGMASQLGIAADRGAPPVASFGLWKAYQRSGDRSFVEEYYEPLCRYHAWWRRNRDGNNDGLLEWGSNPTEAVSPQWQAHSFWASRYESGMDNHPTWDGVRFNPRTNTQEQSDIGLNALFALDARCLARMAELLGRKEDVAGFEAQAAEMTRLIEEQLWNDELGLWLSRDWRGAWNMRASSMCFYPVLLPEVDSTHVDRAIVEHLQNPGRFGGRFTLPVSPRDDPAYSEQYYMRGRIWSAQALIVHAALREAGREAAAAELACRCLETMRREWLFEGHLHQNYHAETADGDDTAESDPVFSFGVMLPMTAWNHFRDRRLDGSLVEATDDALHSHLDPSGALRQQIEPIEQLSSLL